MQMGQGPKQGLTHSPQALQPAFAAPYSPDALANGALLRGIAQALLPCLIRGCSCPQNFVALIPLALVLGEVTEDLATRFGDVIGGLLNATFGNVVELILSIAALTRGLYTVVAMSLIGSILSNLLLVMGEPQSQLP